MIDRWLRDRPMLALTRDPSIAQRGQSIVQIRRSRTAAVHSHARHTQHTLTACQSLPPTN